MYIIITKDFNGYESEYGKNTSFISIKDIYHSLIRRCIYGFPDIAEIRIEKDGETVSSFVNWRR